ncbi:MAG: ABC transporter ATP-binding protein/permease [Candidatus Hydrothermae bacterium]|nr:ABC transporter ATP-binding protein/permease [Candidatus Hydrothermae bacterium]
MAESALNLYRWLWPYLRRHLHKAAAAFVLMILMSLVQSVSLGFLSPVLRVLFGMEGSPDFLLRHETLAGLARLLDRWLFQVPRATALTRIAGIVVALYAFRALTAYLFDVITVSFEEGVIRDLRNQLFERVVNLPLGTLKSMDSGKLISRFYADISRMRESFSMGIFSAVRELLNALALFALALWTSWHLTLLTLFVVPLSSVLVTLIGKGLRRRSRKLQERMGEIGQHLFESLGGVKVIKAFGTEDREARVFAHKTRRFYWAQIKFTALRALNSPLSELSSAVVASIVLLVGGRLVLSGHLSPDEFLVFLAAILSMMSPLKRIAQAYGRIQSGLAAVERVRSVMELPLERTPFQISGKPWEGLRHRIFFDHVVYTYPDGTRAIRGVTLEVFRGERVAIVGPSGAGKSTLMDLLARFDLPQEGTIWLDDLDIRELDPVLYRRRIAIVPQEVFLFSGTIRENIAYGKPDATEEEIREAARLAHAEPFILRLPQGYDTRVGEGGIRLSGGERQRIALARAIIRRPDILILDEPTSALDAESEEHIRLALDRILEGRTSFTIAHRLATVLRADKIVVMNEGRVEAVGSHDELLHTSPLYARLYSLQFGVSSARQPRTS